MTTSPPPAEALAVRFASLLLDRQYGQAHALLTPEVRNTLSMMELAGQFEACVPLDWEEGRIERPMFMNPALLPDARPGDLGWYYVPIGGNIASEGMTVIVGAGDEGLAIRTVEFGRP